MGFPTPSYLRKLSRAQRIVAEYDSSLELKLVQSQELLENAAKGFAKRSGEPVDPRTVVTSEPADCLDLYDGSGQKVAEFYFCKDDSEVRVTNNSFLADARQIKDIFEGDQGRVYAQLHSLASPLETQEYGSLSIDPTTVQGYIIAQGETISVVIEHEMDQRMHRRNRFYVTCKQDISSDIVIGDADTVQEAFDKFIEHLISSYEMLTKHSEKVTPEPYRDTRRGLMQVLEKG